MGSPRRFTSLLLASVVAVVVLTGCPISFGYYAAGNKFQKIVETPESLSAVPVATPLFRAVPASGGASVILFGTPTQDRDQVISIDCATEGALIYYTYTTGTGEISDAPRPDPNDPATHLFKSSEPIVLAGNDSKVNINAVAFKALMLPSSIATLTLTVSYTTASSPTFDKVGGTYEQPFTLTITDSTEGSTIWYTVDGSEPHQGGGGTTLSGASPIAVAINGTCTVRAIATESNHATSPETVANYVFAVSPPTFAPQGGTYQAPLVATIGAPTAGSEIWYTTNGVAPDPAASIGTSATPPVTLPVDETTTIRALAYKPGWGVSPVTSVAYTITLPAPSITNALSSVGSAILTWDPVPNATEYNLYYRQGSSVTPADGIKLRGVNSPRTVVGLQGGTPYAFIVTAVFSGTEGAPSATKTAQPLTDDATTGFTIASSSSSTFYAEWKELGDVQVYQIFEDTSPTGGFETLVSDGAGIPFQKVVGGVPEWWEYTYLGGFAPGEIRYFKLVAYYWYPGNIAATSIIVPAATYTDGDMPNLKFIETGSYAHPATPPPGAASGDSWLRSTTLQYNAWTQGPWTYLLWDSNDVQAQAFAITAYDPSGSLVGEWIDQTNSWIYTLTLDPFTWNLQFAGEWGVTEIPLRNLKL